MEYIRKEAVMNILGLDKNKAGDWKTYFDLYEKASDDIISGAFFYSADMIGTSSNEYKAKQISYPKNERPIKYKGWEFLSKSMVILMLMRADTNEARKKRLECAFSEEV